MTKTASFIGVACALILIGTPLAVAKPIRSKPNTAERKEWCRSKQLECMLKGRNECEKEFPGQKKAAVANRNNCFDGVVHACGYAFGTEGSCISETRINPPKVTLPKGGVFAPN